MLKMFVCIIYIHMYIAFVVFFSSLYSFAPLSVPISIFVYQFRIFSLSKKLSLLFSCPVGGFEFHVIDKEYDTTHNIYMYIEIYTLYCIPVYTQRKVVQL